MILSIYTAAAYEYEGKGLKPLIKKLEKEAKPNSVYIDKGYSSKENIEILKSKKIKDRVQHKGTRGNPLKYWSKKFNKITSKRRVVIERTFGSIKSWFQGRICRYKGKMKTHTQHIMQAIAYNLKRAPRLYVKNMCR